MNYLYMKVFSAIAYTGYAKGSGLQLSEWLQVPKQWLFKQK